MWADITTIKSVFFFFLQSFKKFLILGMQLVMRPSCTANQSGQFCFADETIYLKSHCENESNEKSV